jgi:transmembrane sensor
MNTADFRDQESGLEEAAASWIVEREEGFTSGRAEAFANWLSRDPRHAEAIALVERALALLEKMPAVRGPLEARIGKTAEGKLQRAPIVPVVRFNPWAWAAGLAAALVLCAAIWWIRPGQASAPQTFAADASEPQRIALSDGSVVDLNLSSRLQVQFSEGVRRVALSAGEAHFQVAHNAARPFIVTANGISIRAVGTAFDVRLIGDKVDVFVAEGKVQINWAGAPLSNSNPLVPLLTAGQLTQVSAGLNIVPRVELLTPAAARALLSWQDRMTSFINVPLREMIARINRCNSRQLVLMDPGLGDRKIGGVIDLSKVDTFVQLLIKDGEIIAERRPDGAIVLHSRR